MTTLVGCVLTLGAQDRDSEMALLRGAAEDGDGAAQFTLANHYYRGFIFADDTFGWTYIVS